MPTAQAGSSRLVAFRSCGQLATYAKTHAAPVRPLSPGYATYEVEPVLGGLQWMEGEVPTPHGNIALHCSRTKLQVQTAAGSGVLRFRSKSKPGCKEAAVRAIGGNQYELTLQANSTYTVNYAAVE